MSLHVTTGRIIEYALATNSGTAALTLAFRALRADPGDEVIVPAFTFVASALAAVHAGLVPRFCDVRPDTYGIDLAHAETLLTERTRAIVVVHLNGVPADLAQARRLADRHGLALVEDACQAHGARWNDQQVGGIGFAGAFSFNRSKNLPAGEGGMVVTDSEDAFDTALAVFQFGGI
ncbi:MAG: aminotransferase class I/II-fold pyridoxal phosphate-dependent enzyme [Streptosporangiaceae bacterium]|nr:aminotransferase class I/II-fold pyridoxal phosphate-dependent enzyme [Streptosporangiaceae bacterium]